MLMRHRGYDIRRAEQRAKLFFQMRYLRRHLAEIFGDRLGGAGAAGSVEHETGKIRVDGCAAGRFNIQISWRRLFGLPLGGEFAQKARHIGAQTGASAGQVVARQNNFLARQPSAKQRSGKLDGVMVKQRKGVTRCRAEQIRPDSDTGEKRAP